MRYLRPIFWFGVMLCSLLLSQTPYNAMAHGLFIDHSDAGSFAQGTTGFVPGFNPVFSVGNPSTWSNLQFAYLTVHYNTGEVQYEQKESLSDFGRMINAAFLVPIKRKYAWGLGLRPLTRKQFSVKDDSVSTVIFSEDTLTFSKSIQGSGGMSALYSGISWNVSDRLSIAAECDFLFGVFTELTSTELYTSDPPTLYQRHFQYSGTLFSLYLRSDHLTEKLRSSFYLGYQLPVGSSKIREVDDHPFKDSDGDTQHTNNDVGPSPADVTSLSHVHSFPNLPSTLMMGWIYNLGGRNYIVLEILRRRFSLEKNNSFINSLSSSLRNGVRLGLGFQKEGRIRSRQLLDRLHYRVGIFQQQHYISPANHPGSEAGFSFGFGVPFGITQNQIDIGFRLSRRVGFSSDKSGASEFIRQITIGLTIGDFWLVKRKRR